MPKVVNALFEFKGLDRKTYHLTEKQKNFVEAYLTNKGCGTDAIIEAGYDIWFKDRNGRSNGVPNRKLAAKMAYDNLSKPEIEAYINYLLEEYGYNDENVKRQHLFLLNQHSDFRAKAKAIDMIYKLNGSYAAEKQEHTIDAELRAILEKASEILK